jgi:hypothetical protein
MSWTPLNKDSLKVIVVSASDLNNSIDRKVYVELTNLNDLRLLMMKAENPIILNFAPEERAPAEMDVIIYDDAIEEEAGDDFEVP